MTLSSGGIQNVTKDINLHELNSWEREAWAKFCSLTEYHKEFEIVLAQVPLGIRRAVKHRYKNKEFVERRISQIIDEGCGLEFREV